ncbi:MAG: pyridoxal phosphate-dependent aminotransferase [Clostridia bacterium]|nr:pyridoxal phosphate-dependent aminotransferase [Clostridia bacterium]
MAISNLASSIKESMTLAITAKAKKLKAEGKSIIGFTAGEPDFDSPEIVKSSAHHAIDIGFTKYTPASGMPELKSAICEKLKNENGLDYKPSQIVVSSGAKSSLYHAILAIVNPDDEVIIPTPFWLTYEEQVKLAGGKCVFVDTSNDGYKLNEKLFRENITEKTKAVIINSPSNPTGAVYTEEELKVIAKVALEHDLYVISDEIYEKLVYGIEHKSIAQISPEIKEKTIVINGMSKAYSMTGWRIGYSASSEEVAKAMSNIQSHTTSNACSISQYASVTALKEAEQFTQDAKNIFAARRLLMIEFAKKLKNVSYVEPQGAFYLFIKVSSYYGKKFNGVEIKGSIDFANALLDFGVAVIPGIPFGDDSAIRLSYAVSEVDIVNGFDRINKFLDALE